ncbi:hypothetical protein CPPEL_08870 [Corynebacterium pseudopelargi]|uniref:Uncharacterized protein n=1 Tax=Corynebacterium pseudopelargi TaxID=2080757 RepID=A0A3G6IW53_9CORY|nr:hypothetical protein CPPEL_08870 [Corynebacterium pseudopelargi]
MRDVWVALLLAVVVYFTNWALYRNGVISQNASSTINFLLVIACASYGFFRKK